MLTTVWDANTKYQMLEFETPGVFLSQEIPLPIVKARKGPYSLSAFSGLYIPPLKKKCFFLCLEVKKEPIHQRLWKPSLQTLFILFWDATPALDRESGASRAILKSIIKQISTLQSSSTHLRCVVKSSAVMLAPRGVFSSGMFAVMRLWELNHTWQTGCLKNNPQHWVLKESLWIKHEFI